MDSSLPGRVIDLAIAIQQIPAPTLAEAARATFIRDQFLSQGVQQAHIDEIGNVVACLPGEGSGLPLVVSAHMDTVFPLETDLTISSVQESIHGPGIGDNALGVAGLFGLLWSLRQDGIMLPGDLYLIATIGEEGLGNLRGMQAVVDYSGGNVLAYLVLEGISLGYIFHRGMHIQRYRIRLRTPGGHSWVDFGNPSAIHEMARLVTHLTELTLAQGPRTTLNVGLITGGMSVNTIAPLAEIEIDLRSEHREALEALVGDVKETARLIQRKDLNVDVDLIGWRPAGEIPVEHPLVKLAADTLRSLDIEPRLTIGSTDANLPLSRGYPAICVGLTTGGGAHTMQEHIDVPPLAQGLAQLRMLVEGIYSALG